jgi:hypothetical protein
MAAFVDKCATEFTLTVAWADPALQFVADIPRAATDIVIRLRDPKGRLLHPHDSYIRRVVGTGYAVFEIQEPMPGEWYVEVNTAPAVHTRYTVGGFVRSPIQLTMAVNPPRLGRPGPLGMIARVYDGPSPIIGIRASAKVVRPAKSIDGLLQAHRSQLGRIRPRKGRDGLPGRLGQLITLRNQLLSRGHSDLFAHRVDQVILTPQLDYGARAPAAMAGTASPRDLAALVALPLAGPTVAPRPGRWASTGVAGRVMDAKVAGSCNVIVTAAGFAPSCGSRFIRRGLVSVLTQ